MEKHILYGATVICEKQPVDNPWIEHRWVINDLLPKKWVKGDGVAPAGYVPLLPLHIEKDNEGSNNLYIADVLIDLHHAEAEAYAENLQSSSPAIYIVLRPIIDDDESEAEMMVVEISLSPYTIQDYEDCGEDIIVKLPLAGPVANLVQEFVDTYFKPEKFVKRKRDKAKLDEQENRGGDQRIKRNFN